MVYAPFVSRTIVSLKVVHINSGHHWGAKCKRAEMDIVATFHELIQSGWFLENNNSCIHSLYFRFLATGIYFQDLQYEFHVAKSTMKGIVQETCAAV